MAFFSGRNRVRTIVFTDIYGYSALCQKDEELALRLLDIHRGLVRRAYKGSGVREIKTMGDGFLLVFRPPLKAAQCAVRMQQNHHEYNAGVEPARRIHMRIGIHVGKVQLHRGDAYGDDVNIAARIEPVAQPGGICLSGAAARLIRGDFGLPVESLGHRRLKNIAYPMEVFRVVLPWAAHGGYERSAERTRLAVLPFADIKKDADNEYFADGMTEELIYRISRINGLRVIAQTSVAPYKGSTKSVGTIAEELQVGTVLEGSVRTHDGRLRVTVQLIDGSSQEHIWSDRYDVEMDDVFAVQTSIAEQVASRLEVVLTPAEQSAVAQRSTANVDAYNLYLQARHLVGRRVAGALQSALAKFRAALELDPEFGPAHAGVADTLALMPQVGLMPFDEAHAQAERAARQAIQVDRSSPAGYVSLAVVYLHLGRVDDEVDDLLSTALELNPDYATAEYYKGLLAMQQLRMRDAASSLRRAAELDPLNQAVAANAGLTLSLLGHFDEAERLLDAALELGENWFCLTYYSALLVYSGRAQQAVHVAERIAEMKVDQPAAPLSFAIAYLALGDFDRAMVHLDELHRMLGEHDVKTMSGSIRLQERMMRAAALAAQGDTSQAVAIRDEIASRSDLGVVDVALAYVETALGNDDAALKHLREGRESRDHLLSHAKVDPAFAPLRGHPEFQSLLQSVQLQD